MVSNRHECTHSKNLKHIHLSKFLERYPGLHTILRLDKFLIFQDSNCVTVNLRLLCSDFARFSKSFNLENCVQLLKIIEDKLKQSIFGHKS